MKDLIIRDLCKTYNGKTVLDRLNLTIPAGKTTAILAPSGYGKTTLLRCLMGLETADSGTIEGLEGIRVSVVFQEDRLLEGFGAEANIRLCSPEASGEQVREGLRAFSLGDTEGKPVSAFSGGMKRRVSLLRALMAPYDLLLLDEPFHGLDEELREQIMEETNRRSHGKTVVLVTHDPYEAERMQAVQTVHLESLVQEQRK